MSPVVDRLASGDAPSRIEADAGIFRGDRTAFVDLLEHLCCPVDQQALRWVEAESVLLSADGARRYPVVDGIPCVSASNEWPPGTSVAPFTFTLF